MDEARGLSARNAKALLESCDINNTVYTYVVPIGTDINGQVFQKDFADVSHLLVTGFSGSGKTSFVQTVLSCLIESHDPEHLRIGLFDSKAVDYNAFNGLPHLITPIITECKKACGLLQWAMVELKKRLKLFAEVGAKDLAGYNRVQEAVGEDALCRLFIVLDDYYELQNYEDATEALVYLTRNGRSAGIHCIVVTSVPSSKTLVKDISSNIPFRISFCVANRADSRFAIGQNGAENLNSPGEIIFRSLNELIKCQASYIPYDVIQSSNQAICLADRTSLHRISDKASNLFAEETNKSSSDSTDQGEYDELLPAAAEVVIDMRSCSVSMLQRRLKLGYSRCARIVDQLEELGIVGPYEGAKPRTVLVDRSGLDELMVEMGYKQRSVTSAPKPQTTVSRGESSEGKANVRKATQQTSLKKDSPPHLRPFDFFTIKGGTISVYGDKIHLSFQVDTNMGKGTARTELTGDSIAALVFKKPSLLFPGYLQFKIKSGADLDNRNPGLINVNKRNVSQLMKLELARNDERIAMLFMNQLSEDIEVPISFV